MRNDVVGLAFEEPGTRLGDDLRERRLAHERKALLAGDHGGGSRDGRCNLGRQRSVAYNPRFVYESVRHGIERWPQRGLAQLGDEALLRGAGRRMAEARGVPVGGGPRDWRLRSGC